MLIGACEGGDGGVYWDWEDRNSSTSDASAVSETFQSIVPASQRRYYPSGETSSSLSGARVVLCGNDKKGDDKSRENSWSTSFSGRRETDGRQEAQVEMNFQRKMDNGFEFELEGSAGIKQDRDGKVEGGAGGRVTLRGDF